MPLPWMSRADRRRWKSARTVLDLGWLMALWLEGEIASRPGYQPRFGPDEETAHLVPTLAALCRAGYITTQSQPGLTGTGVDGLWWEQRAAVELVVTDAELFHRLVDAAHAAGMVVRINDHRRGSDAQEQPVVVTTRDGEPVTAFGGRISRADMAVQWPGLDRDLYDQVAHGTYVSIVAPEYGPAGERLWVVLDYLTGLRREDPANPWTTAESSTYDEAVRIATQLGGVAPQSTLQRRLRLGYQEAHALQNRLVAEGHLDAQAVAAERAEHLQRALASYAQASAATAAYEASGLYALPRDGFAAYQDAAQVAQDAHEIARFYGATAAQLDDAQKGTPVD